VTGAELEAILFRHMPPKFFDRLLRAVFSAHKTASEECAANFQPPETDNILGNYRRAKLEGFMRDTAAMESIASAVVRSHLGSWNHTEIRRRAAGGCPAVRAPSA
jgi:hypothetical protein